MSDSSSNDQSLREALQQLHDAAHPLMVADTQRIEPGSPLLNLLVRAKDLAPLDRAMRQAAKVLGDPWVADRAESSPDETFGRKPWRVALPVITDELREEFGGDLRLIDNDRQWTQEAVDFACMLQGERQSALKASDG